MNYPIVLFDGVCNLCNASVAFIIERDAEKRFRFASLQSDFARELFRKQHFNAAGIDSIVLFEEGKFYIKSTAALKIARHLGGGWFLLYGFIILPAFLRDFVYDIIARNRYKWFGRRETCAIPQPGVQERFLG